MKIFNLKSFLLTLLILMVMTVELFFLTSCKKIEDPVFEFISMEVTQITSSSAIVDGEVNNPGAVNELYIIYDTIPSPHYSYSLGQISTWGKIPFSNYKRIRSSLFFTITLSGLFKNTTYYYYPCYEVPNWLRLYPTVYEGPVASFTTK